MLVTSLRLDLVSECRLFRTVLPLRWGIETFYGLLKTRLGLGNFSGTGAEAVSQDFYATVYLTGLEFFDLHRAGPPRRQGNHAPPNIEPVGVVQRDQEPSAGSAVQRFASRSLAGKADGVISHQSACLESSQRNPPRKKTSARTSPDFHKRRKKHCF